MPHFSLNSFHCEVIMVTVVLKVCPSLVVPLLSSCSMVFVLTVDSQTSSSGPSPFCVHCWVIMVSGISSFVHFSAHFFSHSQLH
ncbi:hypothetical protein K435DRAFT_425086 [Dendrothele bispora CBS 962.96]|uniref:Uncharacterized protein n=1 Tax=Dendrothele bispora (strain CBS 962.96) TaxID=1314807 RepID=A0A4S8MEV9_DENBC|nr:hypothetical protein K435DRAFT_425086 [Dendrothele bispora CBS 962.96]